MPQLASQSCCHPWVASVTLADSAEAPRFTLNSFGTSGAFNQPEGSKRTKSPSFRICGSMFCERTLVVQERKWTEPCPSSSFSSSSSSSSVLCARLLELVFVCLWTSTAQWKRSPNQNSKWKTGLTQAQTKPREVTEGLLIQKSLATLSFF